LRGPDSPSEHSLDTGLDFESILDNLPVGIFVVDSSGQPAYSNAAALELMGRPLVPDVAGEDLAETYHAYVAGTDDLYPMERIPVLNALKGQSTSVDDMEIRSPLGNHVLKVWGSPILDAATGVHHAVAAFIDITEHKQIERTLAEKERVAQKSALQDELTGLNNRRGLSYSSALLMALADRVQKSLVLLYLDLDNLKAINDTFGHPEGDAALKEFSALIMKTFRGSDVSARLGGDEFCVLLATGSDESSDVPVRRLQEAVAQRNASTGHRYELSVSVGTARRDPGGKQSLKELVSAADRSMYEQKAMYKDDPRR
jgi:diguanylate cyclase (GGDEF)-like protein